MNIKRIAKTILLGKEKIYTLKGGASKGLKMSLDPSSNTQKIIGLFEKEIQKPFMKYALQCTHFFDAGASDGYYSLIYRKFNSEGKIYMFEAQARFRCEQEKNFSLNGFSSNYQQISKFVSNSNNEENISIDHVVNIKDDFLLFKIDVEGGELDVLNGAKKTIVNNNCFFVIETHSLELERECIKFLTLLGYKSQVIDQAWYRHTFLKEHRPIAHNRWLIAEKQY